MATIRKKGRGYEVIIKRKALLGDKPVSFTVDTEEEANRYAAHYEAMLDQGVIPQEFIDNKNQYETIGDIIKDFLRKVNVAQSDRSNLEILFARIGNTKVSDIGYKWAEQWVTSMKRVHNLSPSTIKHYVGALARCFDWAGNHGVAMLTVNPLRSLPKKYSTYTEEDASYVKSVKEEHGRDRRLLPGEYEAILGVFDGAKATSRQRPLLLPKKPALLLMFKLALETGMRMSEIHTLTLGQIDLSRSTIFLDKTKNGDKRQVPLSSVALRELRNYMDCVRDENPLMSGFQFQSDMLLPWFSDDFPNKSQKERTLEVRKVTYRLSRQFSRIFETAGCDGLHFHDLRHEATCRMYERTKLSDVQIAKILGWKSLKMALRYANLRASDLASNLW